MPVLARRRARPPGRAGAARSAPSCASSRPCRGEVATRASPPPAATSAPPPNLLRYLDDQRAADRRAADDRTIVVERFRDAVGGLAASASTRSPGARVHAAWGQAIRARLRDQLGVDVQ
jgi:ATP-dependent Lhr-like helicase